MEGMAMAAPNDLGAVPADREGGGTSEFRADAKRLVLSDQPGHVPATTGLAAAVPGLLMAAATVLAALDCWDAIDLAEWVLGVLVSWSLLWAVVFWLVAPSPAIPGRERPGRPWRLIAGLLGFVNTGGFLWLLVYWCIASDLYYEVGRVCALAGGTVYLLVPALLVRSEWFWAVRAYMRAGLLPWLIVVLLGVGYFLWELSQMDSPWKGG
jgi:hypothetical protein